MNTTVLRVAVTASLVVLAGAALLAPTARSQVQALPSYVPIGVSAMAPRKSKRPR